MKYQCKEALKALPRNRRPDLTSLLHLNKKYKFKEAPGAPNKQRLTKREYTVKTSQELRTLSSVTINCQLTKIVINPGSQLPVL